MIRINILMLLFLSLSLAAFGQAEIEEVSVTNLSDLNSSNEDFVAVPYDDGIMYNAIGAKNPCDTCGYLHGMRFAQKKADTDCSFSPSVQVATAAPLPKKSNFSAATFSADGGTMYITRNFKQPGGGDLNEREKKLKIVMAQKNDQGAWTNFTDVPFNNVDFETAHPALSADGQTLFFASDRPGGVGKMDIWKVTRQGDTWGEPINLGAPINSADNEIFPGLYNGTLYFSSNKAGG